MADAQLQSIALSELFGRLNKAYDDGEIGVTGYTHQVNRAIEDIEENGVGALEAVESRMSQLDLAAAFDADNAVDKVIQPLEDLPAAATEAASGMTALDDHLNSATAAAIENANTLLGEEEGLHFVMSELTNAGIPDFRDAIIEATEIAITPMNLALGPEEPGMIWNFNKIIEISPAVEERIKKIREEIEKAVAAIKAFNEHAIAMVTNISMLESNVSSRGGGEALGMAMVTAGINGRRAGGGSVLAGGTYLVGERGPELFTPPTSGFITPNHALGSMSVAGGGITVHGDIHVHGAQNPRQLVSMIQREARKKGATLAQVQ